MKIRSTGVASITSARARLFDIAADVLASGQPRVVTRNGESYVAVMGIDDPEELQRLRAADHLRNLHDLMRAASGMAAGKAISVASFRKRAATLVAGAGRD